MAATDPLILRNIMNTLKVNIMQRKVDPMSAFAIVARGMELLETYKQLSGEQKKDYIIAVVQDLAKGADGIPGTKDDLLPQSTVNALGALLRENILANFISILIDATKGKVNINNVVKTSASCIGMCFGKK